MKRLLILIFILTTFLFLTSCDNNEPTDESSSETSKVEETTTVDETTIVNGEKNDYRDANVQDLKIITLREGGYPLIEGGKYIGKDFEEFYNIHSPIGKYRIIKTYDEFASLVIKGEQLDQSIFENNYVFVYFRYEKSKKEIWSFGGLRKDGENGVCLDSSYDGGVVSEDNENPNAIRLLIIPKADFTENIPLTGDVSIFGSASE